MQPERTLESYLLDILTVQHKITETLKQMPMQD